MVGGEWGFVLCVVQQTTPAAPIFGGRAGRRARPIVLEESRIRDSQDEICRVNNVVGLKTRLRSGRNWINNLFRSRRHDDDTVLWSMDNGKRW
jgi:hypothetical protein